MSVNSPEKRIGLLSSKLDNLSKRAQLSINDTFNLKSDSVKKLGAKLETLNPVSVLNRGYAIAQKDSTNINSVKELKIDDEIKLTLKDGTVKTKVVEI